MQAETGSVTKRDFAWVLREFGDITDMTIIEDIFNEVSYHFIASRACESMNLRSF